MSAGRRAARRLRDRTRVRQRARAPGVRGLRRARRRARASRSWIQDHIQRKRRLAPEHMRASAELGALTALHAGITCVGRRVLQRRRGARDARGRPARARLPRGVRRRRRRRRERRRSTTCLERLERAALERAARARDLAARAVHGRASRCTAASRRAGLPWMTHLLESVDELAFLAGHGPMFEALARARDRRAALERARPIAALADVLGPHVVVGARGACRPRRTSSCSPARAPRSPTARAPTRGSGAGDWTSRPSTAPGVLVGLGTDSPSSAGPLDPFAELRTRARGAPRRSARRRAGPTSRGCCAWRRLDAAAALGYDDLGTLDVGATPTSSRSTWARATTRSPRTCSGPARPTCGRCSSRAGMPASVIEPVWSMHGRARQDARRLLALPVRTRPASAVGMSPTPGGGRPPCTTSRSS